MNTIRNLLWATSALQALASPFPQSTSTSSECDLNPNDPASWDQSGAAQYMENWFNTNGTTKWLQAMDGSTTNIEGFSSTLDCRPLDGNTCPAPVTPCLQFTPPELRLIRVAATNAHDLFSRVHEKLQDTAIKNTLSVDQIMLDFGPKAAEEEFNYVNAISAGFFVASPLVSLAGAAAGPAGAILGLIGGLLNLANALKTEEPTVDPAILGATVSKQLKETFSSTADALWHFNSKLFGGSDDTDIDGLMKTLEASGVISIDQSVTNSITKAFSGGTFLAPFEDSDLENGIDQGLARVTQSLVAGILRAQNFFIFINTNVQESDCTTTGSRFIDGKCMIISKRDGPEYPDPYHDNIPVEREILLRLDDPQAGYNIDVTELYKNAYECGGGKLDTSVGFEDGLPKCFYSLPILSVAGESVCDLVPENMASAPGYPAGLKLTAYDCSY